MPCLGDRRTVERAASEDILDYALAGQDSLLPCKFLPCPRPLVVGSTCGSWCAYRMATRRAPPYTGRAGPDPCGPL